MGSQKYYYPPPLQLMIEPGPGSLAIGYVCTSSAQVDLIDLDLQRRRIQRFAESKVWELFKWYEEPEVKGDTEQYHVFAHLLEDAGSQLQIVLCSPSKHWSRNMCCVYGSLDHIRWLGVW
jgi:DNA invertase Pin-like site-specific DNA recombinase